MSVIDPRTNVPGFAPSALVAGKLLEARVPGEERYEVAPSGLVVACQSIADLPGTRLATMVGEDDRQLSGDFRLTYIFSMPNGRWTTIETAVDPTDATFPSVTPVVPAANWYEREVSDLIGLLPEGHPDPRRLVLHENWPEGVYPLRKDFDPSTPVPRVEGEPFPFYDLHGEGIIEIPVGPIHAGVIEPGHFRFAAVGEVILNLEARLFYVHRGIEKMTEGKNAMQALQMAERICGVCSMSHAVAFCQAAELAAETEIPARAAAIRTVMLELERLYNHIGDLGNLCAGVGFMVGAASGARLKDDLQRLNERISGNRFLRSVCQPGGVRRDLTFDDLVDLVATLPKAEKRFEALCDLMLHSETTMERFNGTGILSREAALELAVVGPGARASGVDLDSRRDHEHAGYQSLGSALEVPTESAGDVSARLMVRIREARVSFRLLEALLADLPDGALTVGFQLPMRETAAFSVTESPRGENIHFVRFDCDGKVKRYSVRSASYPNWPAVAACAPGNMVPDFPTINKSWELCYACNDR